MLSDFLKTSFFKLALKAPVAAVESTRSCCFQLLKRQIAAVSVIEKDQ
jgi:hypothetical protein